MKFQKPYRQLKLDLKANCPYCALHFHDVSARKALCIEECASRKRQWDDIGKKGLRDPKMREIEALLCATLLCCTGTLCISKHGHVSIPDFEP